MDILLSSSAFYRWENQGSGRLFAQGHAAGHNKAETQTKAACLRVCPPNYSADRTTDGWMGGMLIRAPEAGADWICSRDATWVGTLCVWPERVPSEGLAGWPKLHPQAAEGYYRSSLSTSCCISPGGTGQSAWQSSLVTHRCWLLSLRFGICMWHHWCFFRPPWLITSGTPLPWTSQQASLHLL